ncbi:MAG: thioredoxin family protein [Sphingomonas sp.]|nr:thioredoxin family protein [Sphingomonas sp.]
MDDETAALPCNRDGGEGHRLSLKPGTKARSEEHTSVAGLAVGVGLAGRAVVLLAYFGRAQVGRARGGWAALLLLAASSAIAIALLPARSEQPIQVPAGTERWSEGAVERYRAQGRPLFVYFTADWCLTCKANEAAVIDREAVRDALEEAGVKILVGDWTNGDPAITRFLESRGRAGVPLYLWYSPGNAEPEELPQILTPAMLTERAGRKGER